MSDNSKKYLWIAAAASAFLLILAAAAFFVFRPTAASNRTPFDAQGAAEVKQTVTTDYTAPGVDAGPQAAPGDKTGDVYIVYGDKGQSTTTVVTSQAPQAAPPAPSSTTITVAPSAKPAPTTTLPPTKAVQAKPSPQPAQPKPQATTAPAVEKSTAVPEKPAAGGYWIQTGSFSKKAAADSARDFLISKHFQAEVKSLGGAYKVRIGPYATKAEAANMLPSVRLIKGYEQAWITQ